MFNGERFDFKILSVLQLQFPVSKRYSPARRYHALVFRIRGQAKVVKGGETFSLTKNDITFVPKEYDYTIQTLSDEQVIVIHFEASFAKNPCFSNFHTTHPDAFVMLFDELLRAWQAQPHGFIYRIDALFLTILEKIEQQSTEQQSDSLSFRIQRAVETMHANFQDVNLSIDKLASASGYCLSYFRRAFFDVMGTPPKEYLISLRMRHATALLESGYYTVEQVATLSGFASAKYFSTAFKRILKRTPSSFLPRIKQ